MNIFILDTNPFNAARMQCDKHCIKQVLETAQILSTVTGGPYRPTHANHPCTLWAKANITNFNWLLRHGLALCQEYTHRYGRRHKSQDVIEQIARSSAHQTPKALGSGFTDFVQCMPDEFKDKDPVTGYRRYYHSKARFAQWRNGAPHWWMQDEYRPFVR